MSGICLFSSFTDCYLFTSNRLHEQNGSRQKTASNRTEKMNGKSREMQISVSDLRHTDIDDRHLSMVSWMI